VPVFAFSLSVSLQIFWDRPLREEAISFWAHFARVLLPRGIN